MFVAQACALPAPLLTTGHTPAATGAIITQVVFFGLGYGLPDLLRGTLLVDYYGPRHYPRINGTVVVVAARAAGPLLAGVAVFTFGSHSATLVAAAALTAISAYALHRAHRAFNTEAAAAGTPAARSSLLTTNDSDITLDGTSRSRTADQPRGSRWADTNNCSDAALIHCRDNSAQMDAR